jgi:hypothetical protein
MLLELPHAVPASGPYHNTTNPRNCDSEAALVLRISSRREEYLAAPRGSGSMSSREEVREFMWILRPSSLQRGFRSVWKEL